ncbi:MAG: SIMPL domain-containing protein [Bacteroidetes bacterium]|nr:SIMPL domain-containing protein [Bacteroidota bacterium]
MEKSYKFITAGIIGFAVIMCSIFLSNAWTKTHHSSNSIFVTGMASRNFTSDLISWGAGFSRNASTIKEAYNLLKSDREKLKAYLLEKGIKESDIVFDAVRTDDVFDIIRNKDGMEINRTLRGYTLTQHLTIESKDVDRVEKLSRDVTELIDKDIQLNSEQPLFFYTKLASLKIEMLAEATKDAKTRADKIAQNAGGSTGSLKVANMGVFQITGQNSAEEYSYGGAFNTADKKKTASITVKLEFDVR